MLHFVTKLIPESPLIRISLTVSWDTKRFQSESDVIWDVQNLVTAEKIAEILTTIEEKSPKSYLINDILTPP